MQGKRSIRWWRHTVIRYTQKHQKRQRETERNGERACLHAWLTAWEREREVGVGVRRTLVKLGPLSHSPHIFHSLRISLRNFYHQKGWVVSLLEKLYFTLLKRLIFRQTSIQCLWIGRKLWMKRFRWIMWWQMISEPNNDSTSHLGRN